MSEMRGVKREQGEDSNFSHSKRARANGHIFVDLASSDADSEPEADEAGPPSEGEEPLVIELLESSAESGEVGDAVPEPAAPKQPQWNQPQQSAPQQQDELAAQGGDALQAGEDHLAAATLFPEPAALPAAEDDEGANSDEGQGQGPAQQGQGPAQKVHQRSQPEAAATVNTVAGAAAVPFEVQEVQVRPASSGPPARPRSRDFITQLLSSSHRINSSDGAPRQSSLAAPSAAVEVCRPPADAAADPVLVAQDAQVLPAPAEQQQQQQRRPPAGGNCSEATEDPRGLGLLEGQGTPPGGDQVAEGIAEQQVVAERSAGHAQLPPSLEQQAGQGPEERLAEGMAGVLSGTDGASPPQDEGPVVEQQAAPSAAEAAPELASETATAAVLTVSAAAPPFAGTAAPAAPSALALLDASLRSSLLEAWRSGRGWLPWSLPVANLDAKQLSRLVLALLPDARGLLEHPRTDVCVQIGYETHGQAAGALAVWADAVELLASRAMATTPPPQEAVQLPGLPAPANLPPATDAALPAAAAGSQHAGTSTGWKLPMLLPNYRDTLQLQSQASQHALSQMRAAIAAAQGRGHSYDFLPKDVPTSQLVSIVVAMLPAVADLVQLPHVAASLQWEDTDVAASLLGIWCDAVEALMASIMQMTQSDGGVDGGVAPLTAQRRQQRQQQEQQRQFAEQQAQLIATTTNDLQSEKAKVKELSAAVDKGKGAVITVMAALRATQHTSQAETNELRRQLAACQAELQAAQQAAAAAQQEGEALLVEKEEGHKLALNEAAAALAEERSKVKALAAENEGLKAAAVVAAVAAAAAPASLQRSASNAVPAPSTERRQKAGRPASVAPAVVGDLALAPSASAAHAEVVAAFERYFLFDRRVPAEVQALAKYHACIRNSQTTAEPAALPALGTGSGSTASAPQCEDPDIFQGHFARRLRLPPAKWSDIVAVTAAMTEADRLAKACSKCSGGSRGGNANGGEAGGFVCCGCGAKEPRPREYQRSLQSQQGLYNSLFDIREEVELPGAGDTAL